MDRQLSNVNAKKNQVLYNNINQWTGNKKMAQQNFLINPNWSSSLTFDKKKKLRDHSIFVKNLSKRLFKIALFIITTFSI